MEIAVLDEFPVRLPQLLQALTQRVQAVFEIRTLICQLSGDGFLKGVAEDHHAAFASTFPPMVSDLVACDPENPRPEVRAGNKICSLLPECCTDFLRNISRPGIARQQRIDKELQRKLMLGQQRNKLSFSIVCVHELALHNGMSGSAEG
jgi:hypothetical protein